MNKLMIGLLILAAAGGAFLILREKKQTASASFDRKMLVGRWSPIDEDSKQKVSYIDILDSGIIMQHRDSIEVDTLYYKWTKENHLVVRKVQTDTTGEDLRIALLSVDSLHVISQDSSGRRFVRGK